MMITPTATTTAHAVRSADGATISYLTVGKGSGLLVIPGALATAATYMAFASALAHQFMVHVIDRRGHGRSGPQEANYSMTTECEDVLAVQRETGASLLVGHSFGGLVALEVSRNQAAFTKIAVYEPGVSINGSIPMGWMPRYAQYLTAKQYRDAFVVFALGTGPDRARSTPPWLMNLLLPLILTGEERRRMFGLLPENLREHQEVARLDSSYANYREIAAEVLLMYGGKSHSSWVDLSMERLAAVLPHAETQEFPKLDHFGIDKKAPHEVAAAVNRFFLKKQPTA